MRIDLHTHSSVSDGTASPAEVMTAAAAAGVDVVALTDHDTTTGWQEAVAALPAGLTLVPGAELSCEWHDGDRRTGMHMLAYLFDPTNAALTAAMTRVREALEGRAQGMVELLRAGGVEVSWDEVRKIAGGDTVGRPHIAQALVNQGHLEKSEDAFEPCWLGERYYVPKQAMDVFEAVALIRQAGGVAVLAHPRRRGKVVPDELLTRLKAVGLFGVEVDHPEHDPEARAAVRALAAELGLVVTGSSDFHGTRKASLIGDNTTDQQVYEQIVAAAKGYSPVTVAHID